MSELTKRIIARMVNRTKDMKPDTQPTPCSTISTATLPPVAGVAPQREPMRPRLRMCDRDCDVRGNWVRYENVVEIIDGWPVVVSRRRIGGRRGAKKPKYKTHHDKRRIG
jgi:hypothetical protein